jgi:hypothetical protein
MSDRLRTLSFVAVFRELQPNVEGLLGDEPAPAPLTLNYLNPSRPTLQPYRSSKRAAQHPGPRRHYSQRAPIGSQLFRPILDCLRAAIGGRIQEQLGSWQWLSSS